MKKIGFDIILTVAYRAASGSGGQAFVVLEIGKFGMQLGKCGFRLSVSELQRAGPGLAFDWNML